MTANSHSRNVITGLLATIVMIDSVVVIEIQATVLAPLVMRAAAKAPRAVSAIPKKIP